MSIFLLWFSIFSFTVFSLSILTVILRWRRRGRRFIDGLYLTSMLSIAVWLILFTFLYFSDVFVNSLSPGIRLLFGLLRAVVTLFFLISYSFFLRELSGRMFAGRYMYLIFIIPLSYILMLIPVFRHQSMVFAMLITTIYNAWVTGLSLTALLQMRKHGGGSRVFLYFLRLMLIYHLINLAIAVLPVHNVLLDWQMVFNVIPRALFCLSWGMIELIMFIGSEYRKEREGGTAIPRNFLDDFGITPREQDIIRQVKAGLSNREAADKLYISEKTVETHISSIYRKCGVKNKVGLLNILSNYT